MNFSFVKMHGAGNDFIVTLLTEQTSSFTPQQIRSLCHRQRGIGADGLILLDLMPDPDGIFQMYFYNNDGSSANACGNGLRCAASYLYAQTSTRQKEFRIHCGTELFHAQIRDEKGESVSIALPLTEPFVKVDLPEGITVYRGTVGVPHGVVICDGDPQTFPVNEKGRSLRNHPAFAPEGINVDFLFLKGKNDPARIRTYERGVEEETLACGTGCCSAGVVLHEYFNYPEKVSLLCQGKDLIQVDILKDCSKLSSVKMILIGPVKKVFEGNTDPDGL